MSTQSSLSTVLASDNMVDTSLDAHARNLSSRIRLNDNMQDSWMNNLDEISKDVEGLFANEAESSNTAISRSLPSSGSIHRSHLRRPSVEFRRSGVNSTSDSSLNYTNHARNDLVAPPPRALTIYVDSTEDPSAITLPSTLGLRSYTLSSTSLPADLTCSPPSDPTPSSSRAADILVTLTKPPARPKARRSSASSTSTATTITSTIFKSRRASKSPPPLHIQRPPSKSPSPQIRSRSLTRNDSPVRYKHSNSSAIIEPIEELSASSEKSPPSRSPSTSRKPPLPRPSLLTPPTVEPVASTSTATASISKLFTKGRHSSSTRPPSPPRHSSLKVRSTPATPTMHTPSPSMSGSLLIVPDALNGAGSSRLSSGQSTPKRISFAQLPEFTTGTSSRPSTRGRKSKSRSKSSLPTSRKGRDDKEDGEDPGASGGWFSSWLLGAGAASTKGGGGMGGLSGPSASVLAEERFGRSVGSLGSWGARPGLGGLEDWAV
ncbi:unnamed protein product [Somion occarium]|uniref:Uncharacterized protein n=1 Tax=Somion occarium TaxID=3059160 RepID=A0ABP1CX93_9APHY